MNWLDSEVKRSKVKVADSQWHLLAKVNWSVVFHRRSSFSYLKPKLVWEIRPNQQLGNFFLTEQPTDCGKAGSHWLCGEVKLLDIDFEISASPE